MPIGKIADTDLAWLAGFFDGDGSIHAAEYRNHKFRLRLSFGQKDPAPLVRIQELLGGYLRCKNQNHPDSFCSAHMHYLAYGGKASYDILKLIRPYVVAKKEQVEVALILHDMPTRKAQVPLAQRLKDLKRTYMECPA